MVIEQGDSVAWIHTSALATEPDMALWKRETGTVSRKKLEIAILVCISTKQQGIIRNCPPSATERCLTLVRLPLSSFSSDICTLLVQDH